MPIAKRCAQARDVLFLGRGATYPVALEGALKLKEISYIHAEGYAAGEMKHGPIALVDEQLPVVVLATRRARLREDARQHGGGPRPRRKRVRGRLPRATRTPRASRDVALTVPPAPPLLAPLLSILPLQFLAYHVADLKGTDVDQPRNLAKSVTVE